MYGICRMELWTELRLKREKGRDLLDAIAIAPVQKAGKRDRGSIVSGIISTPLLRSAFEPSV